MSCEDSLVVDLKKKKEKKETNTPMSCEDLLVVDEKIPGTCYDFLQTKTACLLQSLFTKSESKDETVIAVDWFSDN